MTYENIPTFLFNIFPRDIMLPDTKKRGSYYRRQVKNEDQFIKYITLMNGSGMNTYTSIYDSTEKPVIDKIVFDLDGTDLDIVFDDVKLLTRNLQEKNIPFSVVFSGGKGFHVYGLLKPFEMSRDMASYYLSNLEKLLSKGIRTVDTHLIGNISAIIRVPNTINKGRYCYPLPLDFYEMSISDILDWSKTEHTFTFSDGELRTIQEITGDLKFERKEVVEVVDTIKSDSIPSMEILEELIRPCIFNEIKKSNPIMMARIDFVSEMRFLSFTPKQILDVIESLNWDNFDEEMTKYQIGRVFEKRLKPYSNSKINEILECKETDYYWWRE